MVLPVLSVADIKASYVRVYAVLWVSSEALKIQKKPTLLIERVLSGPLKHGSPRLL